MMRVHYDKNRNGMLDAVSFCVGSCVGEEVGVTDGFLVGDFDTWLRVISQTGLSVLIFVRMLVLICLLDF